MRIEDLLAQRPRIRALALALLRDPHDADDVVQETMARALEHRPRHAGWLVAVARNAAASLRRKRKRARAREQEVARPEASPSTARLAERAEWHRRVVGALLELPEADRDVLLMRYFDDLTPKEIARRLGEPAGTVRSRLKRALDRLRARFDAEHGGRAAWIVPLASVVHRRSLPASLAVVPIVAVVVALVAWGVARRGEPRIRPDEVTASGAPVVEEAPEEEGSVGRVAAGEVTTVAGFVLDWRDRPVPGAHVRAYADGAAVARTTAGDDGAFTMTVAVDARPAFVATAPGYAPGFADGGLVLRLQPVVPLFGDVVDVRGEPVVGVRVSVWRRNVNAPMAEGRTDDRGAVNFDGLGPGFWQLRIEAPGFAPRRESLLASDRPFRVRLTRGRPKYA